MRVDEMNFDAAMQEAQRLRDLGYVGISIFHRHQYRMIKDGEDCYSVYAFTPDELAERIREADEPEPPMPAFEIVSWKLMNDDTWEGGAICEADTLPELLVKAQEQNKAET